MSSPWLWYLSRATGVVSMLLLTVVVLLGLYTGSGRVRHAATNATVMVVHRILALGMSVFLLAHIVTAVVDSYVDVGWWSTVLPFTSGYETLWVGFGTIAFDLLLAILVTSIFRHRLPERAWKAVHLTTYVMTPIALVHGLNMGTASEQVFTYLTAGCALVLVVGVLLRVGVASIDTRRRQTIAAQEWS